MNKLFTLIKSINNWMRIWLLGSISWIIISTSFYFVEIYFNGSSLIPTTSFNNVNTVYSTRFDFFHNYFNWDTRKISTWQDMDTLKSYKVCVIKPSFNALGFLKLLLLPIFIGWLLIFGINIFIWRNRQYLFDRLMKRWVSIDPFVKAIFFVCLSIFYLFLYFIGFPYELILMVFGLVLILIPVVWFFIKKALYEIVFLFNKAIIDAKKEIK